MTDMNAYELLSDILSTITESEYPEIYNTIQMNLDTENKQVYFDAYTIANQLHEADGAKQLPKCVADFLIAVYEDEMNEGNADAACDLGTLYYTGRCGEQSYAKALAYYDQAAKLGSRQAQENLGYCYYYGRDTAVDYEKAFHYFALGAFDGHLRSLYKIGDMYRNGYYVEQHPWEAFSIYLRCANTMTEDALPLVGADVMMRIADCYYEGIGTEPDFKLALHYYHLAERMFYDRLEAGDYFIKDCYDKVIRRQAEVRQQLMLQLPGFDWTKPIS
jgi:hypothetical protein